MVTQKTSGVGKQDAFLTPVPTTNSAPTKISAAQMNDSLRPSISFSYP